VTDLLLRGWGVPTSGAALAVSTDGSRIVGFTDIHYHASLWTDQSGTVDLNDWLPLQGVPTAGWSFIEATGISGDGDAIVGVARHVDGSIDEPRLFLLTGVTSALPIFANGFDGRWARVGRVNGCDTRDHGFHRGRAHGTRMRVPPHDAHASRHERSSVPVEVTSSCRAPHQGAATPSKPSTKIIV
jgi:hypothetical protein